MVPLNGGPPQSEIPNTPAQAAGIAASGAETKNTGHTEWPDGRVHHTGFTATMAPNTVVPYTNAGQVLDADYNSWQEGKSGRSGSPTYAIITSRSYHSGGVVNTAMADGSTHAIASDIALPVWRAMATRAGAETISQP